MRHRWFVVATALPLFLLAIEFYGITVALPSIGRDLGTGTTALQWTVNAFNLALAAPLVAFGRLGGLVGWRRTMLAGILLFAAGSAVCGLAPGIATLLAGRCIQGLAVALFSAASLAIVSRGVAPGERGIAFGICMAVAACAAATGPLVGGVLTEKLGWRWLFLVNLPIALLTTALILRVVPESRDQAREGGIDLAGTATITAGLTLLTFGLQLGDDWGWQSLPVLAGLIGGPLLILLFWWIENRQRQPLIEPALFGQKTLVQAQMVALTSHFGCSALLFFSTFYLQHILRLGPMAAGLVLLAFSCCFVLTLPGTRIWTRHLGNRQAMMLGMVLMVTAFLLCRPIGPDSGLPWLIAALATAGIGQALAFNASTTATVNAVPEGHAAAGLLNGARLLGSVLGIALPGAVFQASETGRLLQALHPKLALEPAEGRVVASLLSGSAQASEAILALARATGRATDPAFVRFVEGNVTAAFMGAFQSGMLVCAFAALLGVVATFRARPRLLSRMSVAGR
ncbi:MFS transporter [Geminicoccus harenae]|uniref:MFS transporter n=1 Tax=Geminicoccus harenae TaxID=2498453 RepID=UPI00168B0B77|nr:MFS transporter [Geminicoccus harenae]